MVAALLVYAFYFFVVDRGMDLMLALRTVVYRMFYTTNGIIGTPINVCYTYIVLFIIFGAFLERTGIAGFFISSPTASPAGRAAAPRRSPSSQAPCAAW